MRKTVTLIIILSSIIITSETSKTAGLGGTVYVPNLHAKCLSLHQNCLLDCASEPQNECSSNTINNSALICATSCVQEYTECEEVLAKLRCLDNKAPISPTLPDIDVLLKQLEMEN